MSSPSKAAYFSITFSPKIRMSQLIGQNRCLALWRIYCNFDKLSLDYATTDETVFSPCRAKLRRERCYAALRQIHSPLLSDSCKRGTDVSAALEAPLVSLVRSRFYRRDWSSLKVSSRWETIAQEFSVQIQMSDVEWVLGGKPERVIWRLCLCAILGSAWFSDLKS
jgi:hypothetical protein